MTTTLTLLLGVFAIGVIADAITTAQPRIKQILEGWDGQR